MDTYSTEYSTVLDIEISLLYDNVLFITGVGLQSWDWSWLLSS